MHLGLGTNYVCWQTVVRGVQVYSSVHEVKGRGSLDVASLNLLGSVSVETPPPPWQLPSLEAALAAFSSLFPLFCTHIYLVLSKTIG
jgi:hypothetical protein